MTAVARAFSSDLLGSGSDYRGWSNYLEGPLFYCGSLSLLLAPQAFAGVSRRTRIACGLFALAFVLPVVFPFLRYAYWLFGGDYYRAYSVLVILGLVLFAMRGLDRVVRERRLSLVTLVGTLVVLLVALYWPWSFEGCIDQPLRLVVTVLLVASAALVVLLARARTARIASVLLVLLVAGEAAYLSSLTVNRRDVMSADEYRSRVGYRDHTVDAVRFLTERDAGFYRMDKDYRSGPSEHRSLNDGKIQRYFGSSCYHSFNHGAYLEFLTEVHAVQPGVEQDSRWTEGLRHEPLLQLWSGHRYMLSKTGGPRLFPSFRKIERFGDVEVFESDLVLPLGCTYDAVLPRSRFAALGDVAKRIVLMRAAVVEDDRADVRGAFPELPPGAFGPRYPMEAIRADFAARSREHLRIEEFAEKRIEGTITVAAPRILFFTIPWDRGWSATVDGESWELVRMNVGFQGLVLEPGEHRVVLRYRPPFFAASIAVSVLCLVAYGVLCVRRRRARPAA
jgi:uncharacterized membrane protein YfhO